jgi:hypothetical protein
MYPANRFINTLFASILLMQFVVVLSAPLAVECVRACMQSTIAMEKEFEEDAGPAVTMTLDLSTYKASLRDEGKELFIDGAMHDIVSVVKNGSTVTVTMYRDHVENGLRSLIDKEHNKKSHRSTHANGMQKLIQLMQIPALLFDVGANYSSNSTTEFSWLDVTPCTSISLDTPKQPPRS